MSVKKVNYTPTHSAVDEELASVLSRAGKLVTPSKSEERRLDRVCATVGSLLTAEFTSVKNRGGIEPKQSIGGSYAKGTWLKEGGDIDYFLLYPPPYSRQQLEGEAIESIKRALKSYEITMRFAEHPYVETFVEGVRVNVVPCYEVKKGEWQSAADRSPFHTEYVKSHFNDELRLEARLLKRFVKAAGVYGAEVKVQGFSGYVCEVLALKYGSFMGVLRALAVAKPGELVAVEEYDSDVASTFTSALVILDPVDSTRNLGSAISTRNVARLIMRCRKFLEKPTIADFTAKKSPARPSVLASRNELLARTVVVLFSTEKRSVDILWGQLNKSVRSLAAKLENLGFQVVRQDAASNEEDESAFIFLLLDHEISALSLREGPEYFRGDEARKYVEKNEKRSVITFIGEDGRLYSLFDRSASREVTKVLRNLLADERALDGLGLSRAVRQEISRRFVVQTADRLIRRYRKDQGWLFEGINSLLSREV